MSGAALFAAELGGEAPILDLHGVHVGEVEERVDMFITSHRDNGPVMKIIYGGGTGTLKETTIQYVSRHPMIARVIEDLGYCFVILHR